MFNSAADPIMTDNEPQISALDHALARRASADGDLVSGAYVHNSGPCLFRPRRSSSASAARPAAGEN
ncbi:hypothetical protein [Pseudofrankia sp. DC12]|uniref:hypothetical protein n=1 Tax=Pseudofrankia sp. DC12 TaxID=683315 RepID=UPI000AAFEF83|nr:hypothetical protein [Pseudofrankia sp. DC12]